MNGCRCLTRWWPLCAALVLLASAPLKADQYAQASQWLERMSRAMAELDYQGTFVYLQGDDVQTMRITHVRDSHGVRERLVTVSGPPRELVRDASGVRSKVGDSVALEQGAVAAAAVFPEFPAEALAEARQRYVFEVGKQGRIAGHKGRHVNIMPKDEFRYGYELWLQEDTGLLLRWVLYDSERKPLAKLMFTDLRVGEQVDHGELSSLAGPDAAPAGGAASRSSQAVEAAPRLDLPDGLPPGFRLAARTGQGGPGQVQQLVFSDGLATVSVYLEPLGGSGKVSQGLSRMGTTNAWTHAGATRQVTAIGEVPAVTVKKLGRAFDGWQP
jgi:sigma-E factor negative regulatory protein RseB